MSFESPLCLRQLAAGNHRLVTPGQGIKGSTKLRACFGLQMKQREICHSYLEARGVSLACGRGIFSFRGEAWPRGHYLSRRASSRL